MQASRLSTPFGGAMLKEVAKATLEERVAYLEGQVSEHTQTLIDIRDSIRQLDQRFDRRLDALEDKLDRRFEIVDDKLSRQFSWLVGVQLTTLVAIVGALLARS